MATNNVLSDDDKRDFIRDGFVVLRGAIPTDMVEAAGGRVDEAYENGDYKFDETKFDPVPQFSKDLQQHPDICELLNRSCVYGAMEDLLGTGNVTYNGMTQIAFRTRDKAMVRKGMQMTDMIPKMRYHIDGGEGKLAKTGTPFTLLVGVCLSANQDIEENRGQFTVWKGSHFKLHEVVRQRWKDNLIKGHAIFGGHGNSQKPNIGFPQRLLMNPGDVVLVHQRLGHAGGINLHEEPRKNLYFRIRHRDHVEKVWDLLEGSVFYEYDGVTHLEDDIEEAKAQALNE